jgi:hypothetical protein
VLIFALQKLSVVSSSTKMKDKMPVVSGLGEQFGWTNLMFSPIFHGSNSLLNDTGYTICIAPTALILLPSHGGCTTGGSTDIEAWAGGEKACAPW